MLGILKQEPASSQWRLLCLAKFAAVAFNVLMLCFSRTGKELMAGGQMSQWMLSQTAMSCLYQQMRPAAAKGKVLGSREFARFYKQRPRLDDTRHSVAVEQSSGQVLSRPAQKLVCQSSCSVAPFFQDGQWPNFRGLTIHLPCYHVLKV